jgi:hypothetical protein
MFSVNIILFCVVNPGFYMRMKNPVTYLREFSSTTEEKRAKFFNWLLNEAEKKEESKQEDLG